MVTSLLVVAGVAASCRSADRGPEQRSIDERAGSYKGVALGQAAAAARRVFGESAADDGPATPLGSDFYDGGPLSQPNPPGYTKEPGLLRYDDVAFVYTPQGIHNIVVDDPQAATKAGVGIGEPLESAKQAYPGLTCRERSDGGAYSDDPAHCSGRVARGRYIWFGNDPIRIIALSPWPME